MSERSSSIFILIGGILAVVALWVLSVYAIRRDTRRRGLPEIQQKAWAIAAAALPLFGFALYLSLRVVRQHLTPPVEEVSEEEQRITYVHPPGKNGKNAPSDTYGTVPASQRPLQATYSLMVVEGPHHGQRFIINHLPALVGRGSDASIPLDADLNISRRHAEFYASNGALHIRDLKSTHGTQVNGQSISDCPLAPGDQVSLGQTVLVIRELP